MSTKGAMSQESSVAIGTELVYYAHNHNATYNPRKWDFVKVNGVYLEHFPKRLEEFGEDFEVRDLDESYNECERLDNPGTKGDIQALAGQYAIDQSEGALSRCTGITCDSELKECTCRAGKALKRSATGEITFVKQPKRFLGKHMPDPGAARAAR
jgi:hypothetical protein